METITDSVPGPVQRVALTMDEAAAALRLSVPSVYWLVNRGFLRTYTFGRRRLVSLEALEACVRGLEERGGTLPCDSGANNGARRRRAAPAAGEG